MSEHGTPDAKCNAVRLGACLVVSCLSRLLPLLSLQANCKVNTDGNTDSMLLGWFVAALE